MKKVILLITLILGLSTVSNLALSLTKSQRKKLAFYSPLINTLSKIESKDRLNKIFLDKRIRFDSRLILLNLDQPSQKRYMAHSLGRRALYKGIRFIHLYRKALEKAEKLHSVDKEVIVAILYIETNFNLRRARNTVFNAYATLAFADHPHFIKINLKRLKYKYRKLSKSELDTKIQKFKERSAKKGKWAVEQLKALFSVSKGMKRPILSFRGSFAGAMGYPQFIPTSYLNYAVDGNGDRKVDLYNIYDAISSVGNYLKTVGFKKNNPESQYEAIYHYNRSDDYVQFVLEYSKRLKNFKIRKVRKRRRKKKRKKKKRKKRRR